MTHYCQTCTTNRIESQVQLGKCIYCGSYVFTDRKLELAQEEIWRSQAAKRKERLERERRLRRTLIEKGYRGKLVYFIQDAPGNLVKIGHTSNLARRFWEINGYSPGCDLLGVVRGTKSDETTLHKMFFQFRQPNNSYSGRTEWFYFVKPIRFFIKHFCIG